MLRNWCSWHKEYAEDTKLVRIIETGSGPGGMLYACPGCRARHRLKPLVNDDSRTPRLRGT
jgi:hypothetical protein